jgi:hypothetical protein
MFTVLIAAMNGGITMSSVIGLIIFIATMLYLLVFGGFIDDE